MECLVDVLNSNDIAWDTSNLMNFLYSDEWTRITENGKKQEFVDSLGDAIDLFTSKMMSTYGQESAY